MSIYAIKGLVILDNSGSRVVSKYYAFDGRLNTKEEQLSFEKTLFAKTGRQKAEIASLDKYTAVYRSTADVLVYVIGLAEENELILLNVLNVAMEAISTLLQDRVDKRTIIDNVDYIFLTFDELVDDGIILETDAKAIVTRVALKTNDQDVSIGDQTLSDAVQTLREHAKNFISGR